MTDPKTQGEPKQSGLAHRFILAVVLASGLLALLLSTYQLYGDYLHEYEEVREGVVLVTNSHIKSLRSALYRQNEAQLSEHLKALLSTPAVEKVSLLVNGEVRYSYGDEHSRRQLRQTLVLDQSQEPATSPRLEIVASLDHAYDKVIDSAALILLGTLLKTAFVVMLMFYLFNRYIGRHLQTIIRYTKALELDHTIPLTLEKSYADDEVDHLVNAINRMKGNIESSFHRVTFAEEQSRLILSNTSDGIYGIDQEGKTNFVNPAATAILGYSAEELLGKNNHHLIHHSHPDGSHCAESQCNILRSIRDETVTHATEALFWHKDGRAIPVEYTAIPMRKDAETIGAVITFRNTEHDHHMEHLLYTIAKGVSRENGDEFYHSLVKYLAQTLEADHAFIGIHDSGHHQIKTIAAFSGGGITENFDLALAGTPCERVLNLAAPLYADKVTQDYPGDTRLTELGIESFAATPLFDNSNRVIGVLCLLNSQRFSNIVKVQSLLNIFSARVAAELQRQRDEENLRLAASTFETREAICITDPEGLILRVNSGFSQITGYSSYETVGMNIKMMKSGQHGPGFYRQMWRAITEEGRWEGEIVNRRKNGDIFPLWQKISAVKDSSGSITHYVTSFTDISERKQAEKRIHDLAYYDALTGLPNRRLFLDRIAQAHQQALQFGKTGALILLDIDDFKNINDSLGHPVGDRLLITVAERLQQLVNKGDSVARLSGDEYAILINEMADDITLTARQALGTAERIRTALAEPIQLEHQTLFISQCMGITLFPYDSQDAESIMIEADTAINKAKKRGRDTINIYQPAMQESVDRRMHIQTNLHNALANNEFQLLYQPQVDGRGRTVSAEALVRWEHPQHGTIPPDEFISIAEETGQIIELGYWILHESCLQLKRWEESPISGHLTHLAVNVSPYQFHQPDFVSQVIHIVKETGIDPYHLELELTEGLLIEDVDTTIHKMGTLKRMGIRFSIDDFGTGYSSMSYLKKLPVNKIKIDQSFIKHVDTNPRDAAIVESIITIARSLGFNLIAEGVETEEAFEFLRDRGCECYQGYLFAKPLSASDYFNRVIEENGLTPDQPELPSGLPLTLLQGGRR